MRSGWNEDSDQFVDPVPHDQYGNASLLNLRRRRSADEVALEGGVGYWPRAVWPPFSSFDVGSFDPRVLTGLRRV